MREFIKKPVFTTLCCFAANILFVFVFGLWRINERFFETFAPGPFLTVIGFVMFAVHFAGCLVLRKFRLKNVLKGIFIYQLTGLLCFVLYLIILMLNINNLLDIQVTSFIFEIPHYIFSWWVIGYQPMIILLARILGTWNFVISGLVYSIVIYFTGNSIIGIKKDREFDEKIKDRHLSDR